MKNLFYRTQHVAPEHYNPSDFWTKIQSMLKKASIKTLSYALTLFHCLMDKDTPKWARGIIIGALGYLILPLDAIPDFIPVAGFTDDFGSLATAFGLVVMYVKPIHKEKARTQLETWFGKLSPKEVIDVDLVE